MRMTTTTMKQRLLGIAVVMLLGVSGYAMAKGGGGPTPNWRAVPTYTTIGLSAGFTPDPWSRRIEAGGDMRVSNSLAPGCRGYIHGQAPDVDLNYNAGSYSLYIRSRSSADTTLVVFGPNGRWYCNDDSIGTDPVVRFPNPRSGNYNIWVGNYGSSQLNSATLEITEINP